jgi:precorrin-6B methylase 2
MSRVRISVYRVSAAGIARSRKMAKIIRRNKRNQNGGSNVKKKKKKAQKKKKPMKISMKIIGDGIERLA